MTEPSQDKLRAGAEAANALISRIEERIADHLSRGDDLDEAKAFYEIVEMLETSREVATLRMALDENPSRWGEPNPMSAGDHTG